MAPQPRIGTRLRRAIERKRMTQEQVAQAIGVSRSAVNAWVNDTVYPRSAIGALEELLEVDLTSTETESREIYTDPAELAIWQAADLPDQEKRELIEDLRARRRRQRGRPGRSTA